MRHRRRTSSQATVAPTDASMNLIINENAGLNNSIDTSESMSISTAMSPWPILEHSDGRNFQPGWSENDWDLWNSDLHPLSTHQNRTRSLLSDAFPNPLDWDSARKNGSCDAQKISPSSMCPHREKYSLDDDLSQCNREIIRSRKCRSEISIARLAHLSTRLYPLHRSSCALAETTGSSSQAGACKQANQNPLIDDVAFKSVATWLVHISSDMKHPSQNERRDLSPNSTSTGDTLHNVFSASHQLLKILRFLQPDAANKASTLTRTLSPSCQTSTGGAHGDLWASITPESTSSIPTSDQNTSSLDLHRTSTDTGPSSNQYSETVVRHLVIACHTLLLNIYVAVLIALQKDADRGITCGSSHDHCENVMALADIRLAMAVQLCSYLIERQFQAVDWHLSPRLPTPTSQQPTPPVSTTADPAVMDDLKIEVQQRMARLRETLRL
ncbi:MAG: hypothetical protein L6R41_006222 [Letrouitia leprolyta]|nr:MAG: hypothetical protein L6R41_006222 [Letrouitia leprolyta]